MAGHVSNHRRLMRPPSCQLHHPRPNPPPHLLQRGQGHVSQTPYLPGCLVSSHLGVVNAETYRAPLKGGPVLLSTTQAGPGRNFSQPSSRLKVEPCTVYFIISGIWLSATIPYCPHSFAPSGLSPGE